VIDPLPSDIFRTGQVLNNTYEIEGVLGRGGTGEVYRAVNQVTGRVFAIKALNRQFSGNSDYLELMKREEEMRSILHDAVVRYNECSRTDDGHVYLVMDYIAGPSLADAMLDRRFDVRELLIIAHRAAEGLVVTHREGIVHRDLSPDNIILRDGKPEKATIIDFGIAKDTAADARTIVGNEFAGKYEYAAPEQLDGHAEPRTDLYALGATLLAAWRRETPYLGTTPGEIVRRKQTALDTAGVPEPLKGLVERLSAPRLEDRPPDARAALDLIDGLLKPLERGSKGKGGRARPAKARKGAPLGLLLGLPVLAAAVAGGLWFAGVFREPPPPPLPVAQPYLLTAARPVDAPPRFFANAPDEAVATILRNAYAAAADAPAETAEIAIAAGVPSPDWHELAAELLARAGELEDWTLSIEDRAVTMAGVAPDRSTRDAVVAGLDDFARGTGMEVRPQIAAGPLRLDAAVLQAAVSDLATCGPVTVMGSGPFALGEEVRVQGDFARQTDVAALENSLIALVGDRNVRIDGNVLNEDLCAIRAVLPPSPPNNISIWLGNGASGETNLTGVFRTGENPVVEIHAPADLSSGFLWVMIVDNTGKVFHILPNVNGSEQRLSALGTVEGGLRKIRVLHPVEALVEDPKRLAVRVNEGDYGKSEVLAILSSEPLFDMRRPRDESVPSVAAALEDALRDRDEAVLAVAARIIDARP
jgi:hypothetical protein